MLVDTLGHQKMKKRSSDGLLKLGVCIFFKMHFFKVSFFGHRAKCAPHNFTITLSILVNEDVLDRP